MRTAGVCRGSDPGRHGQSTSWEEPVTLRLGVSGTLLPEASCTPFGQAGSWVRALAGSRGRQTRRASSCPPHEEPVSGPASLSCGGPGEFKPPGSLLTRPRGGRGPGDRP